MPTPHSYGEFVLGVLSAILVDCTNQYPELAKEFIRDQKRLSSAVEQHGLHFVMVTMPAYRKHFDQCLAKRRLTSSSLLHFGVGIRGGSVPRLFRGLILRVFDIKGELRHDADSEAIRLVRQLLGACRKMRMDSSVDARREVVVDFFRIEDEIKEPNLDWSDYTNFDPDQHPRLSFTDSFGPDQVEGCATRTSLTRPSYFIECLVKIQQVADLLTAHLGFYNPYDWMPRHGPGAVSDQRFGSYKYDFKNWPERLESVFPYADFALANYACGSTEPLTEQGSEDFRKEIPAKLITVPKTLATPRLIAAESTALQWCQQSILAFFYERVDQTFIGSMISFRNQEYNGSLAKSASMDQSHATIDLSSASDRVSCYSVERLFRRSPSLLRALQATRSVWVRQDICRKSPDLARVRKYSTMGNATTFPVQSLFFLAVSLGCLFAKRGIKVNEREIRRLGKWTVRVFGDDLIVPSDVSGTVTEMLEHLGLKVNDQKTFTEGNFRESCGIDAFGGQDVSTVNVLDFPRRTSPGAIVSSVDCHNNLLSKGFLSTAAYIQKITSRCVKNQIRFVKHGSGLFGWSDLVGELPTNTRKRFGGALQQVEVRALHISVKEERHLPNTHAGLLQFFIEKAEVVTSRSSTIGYLGRRPQVKLNLRWAAAV